MVFTRARESRKSGKYQNYGELRFHAKRREEEKGSEGRRGEVTLIATQGGWKNHQCGDGITLLFSTVSNYLLRTDCTVKTIGLILTAILQDMVYLSATMYYPLNTTNRTMEHIICAFIDRSFWHFVTLNNCVWRRYGVDSARIVANLRSTVRSPVIANR